MSLGTNPTLDEITSWFTQSHVTITFRTESRSCYTLVIRPRIAVLVRDNTSEAWKGTSVTVTRNGIQLRTSEGKIRWATTPVVSFYVATN
jgi:hypothetical protein